MAQKLTASMPENLDLTQGFTVQFTAVDASSGDVVTAVNVSNASLLVANLSGGSDSLLQVGPFQLIPLDTLNEAT